MKRKTVNFSDYSFQLGVIVFFIVATLFLSIYYLDGPRSIFDKLINGDGNQNLLHLVEISVNDFLENNPEFSLDDFGDIILKKGVYDVGETIIVPKNTKLIIEPGTVLKFNNGKSLISYSPIIAEGSENDEILFTGQKGAGWGAVGLIDSEKSVFRYVKFEGGEGTLVNNQAFFGSLSFVQSDGEITNSDFSGSLGRDSLSVQKSDVLIKDNVFRDSVVDCVDFDNGSGEIISNEFIDCGDEGIDLEGSYDIIVEDNVIINAGDKSIDSDNNLEEILALNRIE
jgi:hypothetical protein